MKTPLKQNIMIITRDEQIKLVSNYEKSHDTKEVIAFIDGMSQAIELMIKKNI